MSKNRTMPVKHAFMLSCSIQKHGLIYWYRSISHQVALLEEKVEINRQNKKGETALHYAVAVGREDLTTTLLANG